MLEGLDAMDVAPPPPGAPVVDVHPYSEDALTRPEVYADIWLEAGPAFWIAPLGVWAVARHAEVMALLRDAETYRSGGGGGYVDVSKAPGWRPPSGLVDADPPEHTQNRAIVSKVLATPELRPKFDGWAAKADAIVRDLAARRTFDGVKDFATAYGHAVVPEEIGMTDHRPELLHAYGVAGGQSKFPFSERARIANADPRVPKAVEWVAASCRRENLAPGGWGAAVHELAEAQGCPRELGDLLVRSLITAGVENTVSTMGSMIHAFAANPDQWDTLRADPSLARNAVEEVMRLEGATYQFFRTTTRETRIGEAVIPADSKVMILLAAANRDPRRWQDPHRFDITRNTAGQLGFGFGPHQCVGQVVARQELLVLLEALVRHVESLRFAGAPVKRVNNTGRGFETIPLEVTPA